MAWDSVLKGISRAYGPGNKIPIQRYSDKKRSSGSPPLSDSFQLQCTGRLRPISIYLSIHLSLFGPTPSGYCYPPAFALANVSSVRLRGLREE